MKLTSYLRLIRLKFVLVAFALTVFLCLYTGRDAVFTFLVSLASVSGVSMVMAICELNDRDIDRVKYEKFEFYRKACNPLVTGEITIYDCTRFILVTFIVAAIIGVCVGTVYGWLNVALAVLALELGLVYILINRTLVGNFFQGLSYFVAALAVSYPHICFKLVLLGIGISFYCISHNISNQIEDYEFELGITETVATVYGKGKGKIIGLTVLCLSFPWLWVSWLFIFPMIILGITYVTDRKEVQDVLRTLNYIVLATCLIYLII